MTRFRDELKVIPAVAWVIALAVYACMSLLLFTVGIPRDPNLRDWPTWCAALFSFGISILPTVFVLLVGYVNGDAGRRGMRRALWTVIALFVPNGIGIILYFFLREPLLSPCPKCATLVRANFAFCPNCGTQLRTACPNCRRPIEPGWKSCAFCGAHLDNTPVMSQQGGSTTR
jgi:RNA polymerase subunit RPABC4/transcription elongation factor Spt4